MPVRVHVRNRVCPTECLKYNSFANMYIQYTRASISKCSPYLGPAVHRDLKSWKITVVTEFFQKKILNNGIFAIFRISNRL